MEFIFSGKRKVTASSVVRTTAVQGALFEGDDEGRTLATLVLDCLHRCVRAAPGPFKYSRKICTGTCRSRARIAVGVFGSLPHPNPLMYPRGIFFVGTSSRIYC